MTTEEAPSSFSLEIAEQHHIKNISFSGGGYKGLAFLGCVKALQEKEVLHSVKSYAGSSVGSIIATMLVCGADYDFLKEVAVGACKIFANYKLDAISMLTRGHRLRSSFGVYKTEALRKYIQECMQKLLGVDYDVTFSDLHARNPVDLIITASCLETKTPFYFSHETTKDTPVSEAVSISCSIPLLFGKTVYKNKTLVDGCLIEKLPMQCWPQEEIEHTMAFLVRSGDREVSTETFTDYINALEGLRSVNIDDSYLSKYKNSITVIDAGNIALHGEFPRPEETSKVIYAAYFQTLSELSRRNFIDEFSVPKSQEISSLLMDDVDTTIFHIDEQSSLIRNLVIILLIVAIIKIILI